MKKDASRVLYDKYFNLRNRNIEIVLKNGGRIRGIIVGYYTDDLENEESAIQKWHVVVANQSSCLDFSGFGGNNGTLIRHRDIASITFEEDQSTMVL